MVTRHHLTPLSLWTRREGPKRKRDCTIEGLSCSFPQLRDRFLDSVTIEGPKRGFAQNYTRKQIVDNKNRSEGHFGPKCMP